MNNITHRCDYLWLKLCPYDEKYCPLKLDWNWRIENCETCERKE